MIRKFLECKTTEERLRFLTDTVISEWSDQDLDVVLNTMGLPVAGLEDKAAKLAAIGRHLSDYRHEVEEKVTLDCRQLDEQPFEEKEDTLYEPESALEKIAAALRGDE